MDALQNSWIAKLTTHTVWGFPINEIIHILSISVLVGISVVFAANCARKEGLEPNFLRTYIAPVFTLAFAVAFISGFIFFAAWPDRYLGNLAFWVKIPLLITLLALNILIIRDHRQKEIGRSTILLSYASVATALSAIAAGRLIAYLG